ncbi:MAG: lipocalin family protein [Candidatus Binatia bacterium]|nr:lipocalin family protein [Candidatus Binatia bacterium]
MNLDLNDIRTMLATVLMGALGCTGIPEGLEPVRDFDSTRYLGTWYEVARLDHPFERGLEDVSARYTVKDDGGIRVVNRGYDESAQEWREAVGKAYSQGDPTVASLEVSFFGPFYGGYHVISLDEDYRDAIVTGPDRSYLWFLSRERSLPRERLDELLSVAREAGFDVASLIWVDQSRRDPALKGEK